MVEEQHDADLILLDLHIPGAHGFRAYAYLRTHFPHIPVVVVSACEEVEVMHQAVDHEASGYILNRLRWMKLPKPSQPSFRWRYLFACVGAAPSTPAQSGGTRFSQTHCQFDAPAVSRTWHDGEGLLNKQIAYDLDVSEATIKAHVTAIFTSWMCTRTQAVIADAELGFG